MSEYGLDAEFDFGFGDFGIGAGESPSTDLFDLGGTGLDLGGIEGVEDSLDLGLSDKPKDDGKNWYDYFLTPGGINTALTTGLSLYKGIGESDAREAAEKRAKEDAKFKYLVELAKLKYAGSKGGGGGGGGSTRNKNADLIEVLSAGNDDRLKALEQFSSGYAGALR